MDEPVAEGVRILDLGVRTYFLIWNNLRETRPAYLQPFKK
jgi:hypothetical protein